MTPLRIVHIAPGVGGTFYCENCIRDNALAGALRQLGHDVVLVPMYLPPWADNPETPPHERVFFGAVNLYLRERIPLLRRLPASLLRFLDAPPVLAWAARRAGSMKAAGLEELTLSMLAGPEGRQAAEAERLTQWLRDSLKPDVVHLSNALLLGLAPSLKRDVRAPIVCSLQDEDSWVDAMPERYSALVWQAIARRVPDVDRFVAVSEHYAARMRGRLGIPADRLRVVRPGVESLVTDAHPTPGQPPAVGFLARLSETLGLGILAEAFIRLKADSQHPALRLRLSGGQTFEDRAGIAALRRRFAARALTDSVDWLDTPDRASRARFLRSLSVLSVPTPGGAAFGVYLLEACSAGVPVVQPDEGAFPEIVKATGGGVLYAPNTAEALARALDGLLRQPAHARELGLRGQAAVAREFSAERMAREMVELYGASRQS